MPTDFDTLESRSSKLKQPAGRAGSRTGTSRYPSLALMSEGSYYAMANGDVDETLALSRVKELSLFMCSAGTFLSMQLFIPYEAYKGI
jgi:hypothetical protein